MSTLDETAAAEGEARLQAQLANVRKERDAARRETAKEIARREELERLMARYTAVSPGDMKIPKWMSPKAKRKGGHKATALLMLSDLHLDEVVDLDEMAGMNEYNREIATTRFHNVIDGTTKLCRDYIAGVTFDGIVVALNGDILTGDIHQELALTNEAPTPASIVHWVPIIASGFTELADRFGKVHVVCTDGNHDRDPAKKRTPSKRRAESSFAWIIYNWLADSLRGDERITFSITTAEDQVFDIYDTTFRQTHGDRFRSQGGVGGIYPSMLKYLYRVDGVYASQGRVIDCHLLGHWHQYRTGPNFIVNGSLKGYDEYAKGAGFDFELPRQAFAVVTPERGIVQQLPVYTD